MSTILTGIFKWLMRQAAILLLVLAVLLGGAWFDGELKKANELKADRTDEIAKRVLLRKSIEDLKRSAADRSRIAVADIRNHESALQRAEVDRRRLLDEHSWVRRLPLSEIWQQIKILDLQIEFSKNAIGEAARLRESTGKALSLHLKQAELELEKVDAQIAAIDKALSQNFPLRIKNAAYKELPTALGILIGIILVPIGIKIFLYFVVAPWAAGRPPVRLLSATSGSVLSSSAAAGMAKGLGKMSAVSLPIVLGEHQELLIRPEYFQSTSLQSRKRTKWLLDPGMPLSSLLSGMFMLTRVEPAGPEPIVISATRDPLGEVGIVDLADGAAFVCQPRSLAGVIQDRRFPIRITRHWRLGSLQSWLTLQLRFLVFHGPGQLVMKGCRGIRIESAKAGRLINQAATLGFSAELDYANVRCETFVSYWTGDEDLFNDMFKGESGVYVYEETPNARRAAGIGGRPLEGFAEAVLKLFGV